MKKSHLILLALTLSISACCSWEYDQRDFDFTQQELNHLGPYNVGDTIYFQSNLGNIDTIKILNISEEREKGNKCFISKPPYHSKTIIIKHLPKDKWAGTTQVEDKKKIEYQSLISISKFPLKKRIDYSVSFQGFVSMSDSIIGNYHKECQINDITIPDCYKLSHNYPERVTSHNNIQTIYWTNKYGLTAYKAKNGETWLLKSLK